MDGALRVSIGSADGDQYHAVARAVVLPGQGGELTVLCRHAPLLTLLRPGAVVVVPADGEPLLFAVSGGFAEVQPQQVTILCDRICRAEDTDAARANQARQRAMHAVASAKERAELDHAEARLALSIAEIDMLSHRYRAGRRR